MSIHRADIKDLEAILLVINKSNSEAYRKIIPPEYFKEPVLSIDELMEDFRRMTFYAYKVEENAVGVAALKVVGDDVGQIRWVYILPEYQRKGVGTSIMEYIENEAKKMRLKKLIVPDVHEKAYWARNFYTKLGYTLVGRTPRPWGDNVIYEKIPSKQVQG
jgi:N-acetylglutamate synthase-like GNAT family acetyltransferase